MNDQQIEELIAAIKAISRGDNSGPLGLEAIAMAICGEGLPPSSCSLVGAIEDHTDVMRDVAEALNNIASAIREGHKNT